MKMINQLKIFFETKEFSPVDTQDSNIGFHIGAFTQFELSEHFYAQPELTFTFASDVSIVALNAILEYELSRGLGLQFGPQFGLISGDEIDTAEALFGDNVDTLNIQLALGLSYDINDSLFIQSRYGLQINDHYSGDVDEASFTLSSLTLGLGYAF